MAKKKTSRRVFNKEIMKFIKDGGANILLTSDMHCGHLTGITPELWQWENESTEWRAEICKYQKWAWEKFTASVNKHRPYTHHINLGDCIDGKGTGGSEHLTTDRDEQIQIAKDVFKFIGVRAEKTWITRGTQFHVGKEESWENVLAREIKVKIANKHFIRINGVIIETRHKTGGSQSAATRASALGKPSVANDAWCRQNSKHPRASIFLRGHTHAPKYLKEPGGGLSAILPPLQGFTDFGSANCDQPVSFGIYILKIDKDGNSNIVEELEEIGQHVKISEG